MTHTMIIQIGVCSYLLIGFWYHRLSATKSAIKAMLVNRVSDTFLFISVMLMWWYLGTTDYTIFLFNTKEAYYLDWICLTMMLGAAGKSAQIGLHTWLADAMEGSRHTAFFKTTYDPKSYEKQSSVLCFSGLGKKKATKVETAARPQETFSQRRSGASTFIHFTYVKCNNVINRELIDRTNFSFIRNYSRNTYSIKKSQWDNLLPIVLGCVLGGNPIRPPSSYIPSYITFRHTNKQILEIISKQMNFLLRENSQIGLRKNFYYLYSKPLPEITNLFNLCYEKDYVNITRRKDNWIRNNSFILNDLFTKFFNTQSLVFWFLLCGTYNHLYKTVMFNIDCYTEKELLQVSNLIENKCNIKTVIRPHITRTKTIYYLYVSDQSLNDFIDLINVYYDSSVIIKKPSVIYAPGSKEYSILIGLMLGDGSISLSTGISGTARYEHTCKHREFLIFLPNQWLPLYFDKSNPTPWPQNNPTQWWRGSKMLPELFDLYTLWYKPESVNDKKVKIIPLNLVDNYFNGISLAYWFMDDGYFSNKEKTFYLCTDNFTYIECQFLVKILQKKCNIKASVNVRNSTMWRIRISRQSVPLFRELVKPYLLPIFDYKLGK
jgi:hypothetical protein